MNWGNAIGIYLVIGTALYGLGSMVRARWAEAEKNVDPSYGKTGRLAFYLGTAAGILLWPIFLIGIPVLWRLRRKNRKLEKLLGYCEHATALEPYCGPCSRQMEREEEGRMVKVSLGIHLRDGDRLCQEAIAAYLKEHPACISCGKAGTLVQYMNSLWVKCSACGRRIFTPDPSAPEEVLHVPNPSYFTVPEAGSCYDCSGCGGAFEGFPPGARLDDGRPLCVNCLRT